MIGRRAFLASAGALAAYGSAAAQAPEASTAWTLALDHARALGQQTYAPPSPLPAGFPDLGYDAYRELRFRPDRALWRDLGLPFQAHFFHRGGLFRDAVEMVEVSDEGARPIPYSPDLYTFGAQRLPELAPEFGFAGVRFHAPINVAGRYDEVAAFLGASYFRAVAPGCVYGLSARALALGSGEPAEEFPAFRRFYLERPRPDAKALAVCAVIDSPSVSGAYRFVITPAAQVRFDIQAVLFPRVRLDRAGLAPLTSMYLFGPEQPRRFDDFRPEVHDTDGLLFESEPGSTWRPLINPLRHQITDHAASGGYGLLQRRRRFEDYQDLEARYDLRPGGWVAPREGFGLGAVRLVELAAREEGEDNIVAFWKPAALPLAGQPYLLSYSLTWGAEPAPQGAVARAVRWSAGRGGGARRRFVVDFDGGFPESLRAEVGASTGGISLVNLQPNAYAGGARLGFELDPGAAAASELTARLWLGEAPASETWSYRWLKS